MQAQEVMKQLVDFQKMTLDAMISVTSRYQEQSDHSAQIMMDRTAYWPQKGLKSYKEWLATTRQCIEDIKPVTAYWFKAWRHIIDTQENPTPSVKPEKR